MKTLYQINKVMMIIWAILMCTIYLGLLFMMPLGFIQVLCSLYLISGKRWANNQIRNWLFIHLIFSVITLSVFGFFNAFDNFTLGILVFSGCLALFFTYITYKNFKVLSSKETDLKYQL